MVSFLLGFESEFIEEDELHTLFEVTAAPQGQPTPVLISDIDSRLKDEATD
jgi:hypothetical protein